MLFCANSGGNLHDWEKAVSQDGEEHDSTNLFPSANLVKSGSDFGHDAPQRRGSQPLDRLEQGRIVERRQDDHHGDVVADVGELNDVGAQLLGRVVVELSLLLHELRHSDLENHDCVQT